MKTKRGRRSEAFWPSIVMKKWLNMKPLVHDFSEDEVETETETETESEDDVCEIKDEKVHVRPTRNHRMQPNQSNHRRKFSDIGSKKLLKHRRGKSETLRAQYINTKDVRVTIGSWNVAGKAPNDDLEIDDWLCTKEPSDIYIIGFQEVVPLNCGNVLGAEDRGPIPKWESIIRRTLNKSIDHETKHKSLSAPPSPVLRTCSVADALAGEIDNLMNKEYRDATTEHNNSEKQHTCNPRTYDNNDRLDWPEHSLDATTATSNSKLRRVFSSSARINFDWTDNPSSSPGLKRGHCSSVALTSMWSETQEKTDVAELEMLSDVLTTDVFSEEEDDQASPMEEEENENGVGNNGGKSGNKYVRIVSKQMVGIYVSVWVSTRLRRHINNLKVAPVGVGLMGYMGNKGSVSVSMSLFQSRLCFVCSHLTSGQKDGAEQRRNADVYEIIRRTQFSSIFDGDQSQTIPSHDQIFWFGDLNYRLNMVDSEVRKLVALKQWDELIKHDQLGKEIRSGRVFDGWKEGSIDFPPTYKFEINSDRYVGENPKEGEKKRSPAWCDRILWTGKGIKQLSYERADLRISDHRPVSSVFLLEVEELDSRKLQRALNVNKAAAIHPETLFQYQK